MRENPDGLEAAGILAAIKAKFDAEIPRESLSPQLSRLGQDKVLQREGMTWKIGAFETRLERALNALTDETPGVAPPGVSSSEEVDDLLG